MNESQKRHYRARMIVAQLFREILNQNGERARLMESLGVETMPVIIPALANTLAANIRDAANRHFEAGEQYVIVPVCLRAPGAHSLMLSVLTISTHKANTFWQMDMNELHENVEMAQLVEALDSTRKWDISELDMQLQELEDLAATV